MSSNLEKLCQVSIEISRPIADTASFDAILILGPAPESGAPVPPVTVYSSLNAATDAGYQVTGDDADPVGAALRVAFSQSPAPTAVYVATQQLAAAPASVAEATPVDGTDQELEAISTTLARAAGTDGWYIVCPAGVSEDQFEEIAQWSEAQEKMFAYTTLSATNPVEKVYYRSMGWFGGEYVGQDAEEVFESNRYLHVAACAKILRYEPGSETWAFKQLSAVTAAKLTTADCKALEAEGLNYFITVASRPITMFGKTCAGEWIDLIRFRDWLKNDMQVRVANLIATRRKIPYTDGGIALVQNQMISSLKAGIQAGGIAPTEYDEDGNEIPAFVTSVPRASSLTATERASRVLRRVSFQARIAGAIHMVEIAGNLTYDNL